MSIWDEDITSEWGSPGGKLCRERFTGPPHYTGDDVPSKSIDVDIYDWVNKFSTEWLNPLSYSTNEHLYHLVQKSNTTDGKVEEAEYRALTSQLFSDNSGVFYFLSLALPGFCFLLAGLFLLRGLCNFIGCKLPKKKDTRPCLFFRLIISILLFICLLIGTIYVSLLLTDNPENEKIVTLNLNWTEIRLQRYQDSVDPECPAISSYIKDTLLKKLEDFKKRILNHCTGASPQGQYELDPFKERINAASIKVNLILSQLEQLQKTAPSHSEENEEIVNLYDMFAYLKHDLEDLLTSTDDFRITVDAWNKRVDDNYKNAKNLIEQSMNKTLSEIRKISQKAERISQLHNKITSDVATWLQSVNTFAKKAVDSKIWILNDELYRVLIPIISAVGMGFFVLAFVATFYKLMAPEGKPSLRKVEIWAGRVFYVGAGFFILTTCLYSYIFLNIAAPALTAKGVCDVLGDEYDNKNKENFYSLSYFGEYEAIRNPEWYPAGRTMPVSDKLSFYSIVLNKVGYNNRWHPERVPLLNVDISSDMLVYQFNQWKENLPETLKNIGKIEKPNFNNMDVINRLKVSIRNIRLTRERDGYLVKFSKQSPLAQLLAQSIDEFITSIDDRSWEPYFRRDYGEDWYLQYVTDIVPEKTCIETLMENTYDFVGSLINMQLKEMLTKQFSILDINLMLFQNSKGLCGTVSDPFITLLFITVVNTFIWVACTVVMMKTAVAWDLGKKEKVAITLISSIETLAAPLMDNQKYENYIYNNPLTDI